MDDETNARDRIAKCDRCLLAQWIRYHLIRQPEVLYEAPVAIPESGVLFVCRRGDA